MATLYDMSITGIHVSSPLAIKTLLLCIFKSPRTSRMSVVARQTELAHHMTGFWSTYRTSCSLLSGMRQILVSDNQINLLMMYGTWRLKQRMLTHV